ncbi:hypothetical protein KKC87_04025 [Patescibacteria group bacterium]|nr:hypothetical protein [Patescibacteria group bacterium]
MQKDILRWINQNGNKFKFSSITAFLNSAIYEKLQKENDKKVDDGSK